MKFATGNISFEDIYKNYAEALTQADAEIQQDGLYVNCPKPVTPKSFNEWAGSQSGMRLINCQLTDLTPDQITDLFGYYTTWAIYFEHQHVEKKFLKEAAVRAKKALEYALKVYFHDEENVKLTRIPDLVRTTATWKAADKEVFRREVAAAKAELPFSDADKMVKALSRAQSKNSDVMRMQGRDANVGWSGGNSQPSRAPAQRGSPRRDTRGRPNYDDKW